VRSTTAVQEPQFTHAITAADLVAFQRLVRRVPVAEHVVRYAVQLARATRPDGSGPDFVKQWVTWGAGPRASQYLVLGAKARAALAGRFAPGIEDVRAVAPLVLRHRLVTNFNAEADGVKVDRIIDDLLKAVPAGVA
jgi:MoxR-like ATPase